MILLRLHDNPVSIAFTLAYIKLAFGLVKRHASLGRCRRLDIRSLS
jgi:hypothetical protein